MSGLPELSGRVAWPEGADYTTVYSVRPDMADPLQWSQALEAEVASLRGVPPLGPDAPVDPDARVRALYTEIHKRPPSALCLSGGGIRSGTFALGVLQGLAHLG